ncbi:hypothetical protein LZ30DRAFT_149148 [Colletotrichum cereale]|nr:hypothetical protein LZ30DRAFT_149148 [Colletotrichum cereale]
MALLCALSSPGQYLVSLWHDFENLENFSFRSPAVSSHASQVVIQIFPIHEKEIWLPRIAENRVHRGICSREKWAYSGEIRAVSSGKLFTHEVQETSIGLYHTGKCNPSNPCWVIMGTTHLLLFLMQWMTLLVFPLSRQKLYRQITHSEVVERFESRRGSAETAGQSACHDIRDAEATVLQTSPKKT